LRYLLHPRRTVTMEQLERGAGAVAAKKKTTDKAMFTVRSAESKNGGAHIKGAAAEGARLGRVARDRAKTKSVT
jgi:hypothetical protein